MTTPRGSSSSCAHSWSHDVFLSFRGPDTRHNFTCHLRRYLLHKGMTTFMDDNEMDRGSEISPALLEAIEGSRIAIIVFSENYASSEWCLDELTYILRCRKRKQQKVYPVFYKVTPSDVRKQTGSFVMAFADHERRYDSEKLLKWKGALIEASHLAGWTYSYGYESTFIDTIVEDISMQVSHPDFIVADHPVGIECRVKEMHDLLDVKSSDVRFIGIWGIAGIGKTTIAKAVYNSLRYMFNGFCFLENVGKVWMQDDGPVKLRKMLLSKILGKKESELMPEAYEGKNAIENKLNKRKVLVILDDVDHSEQVKYFIGDRKTEWFGSGSRIIITTRDKRVLVDNKVENDRIYKPTELDEHEALELLRANAFDQESLRDGFAEHAKDVLKFAQGLPLALQYLGKLLYRRTVEVWEEELQSHMKSLDDRLYETLIRSYNALEDPAKEVFLDIACFFKGKLENDVVESLGPDRKPKSSMEVLQEKALIYIQENHVCMHNLLDVLGKKIVHKQSDEPGKRSRLWFPDDVYNILSEGKGTKKIKGVIVSGPHEIVLSETCFSGMTNLIYFINSNAVFTGETACLPNEPMLIDWPSFPFECLPLNYVPKKLVKLNMPHSSISKLGEKFKESTNLKYINLEGCKSLKQIPNFSGFPNLKYLNLNYCISLAEVHESVGTLSKLVALSLSGCHNLTTYPTRIALTSVIRISFRYCKSVTALPAIDQEIKCLTCLDLSGTGINELPDASVRYLIKLEELLLRNCKNLTSLPCSIYDLLHLRYLDLHNCSKLVALPQWSATVRPANLTDLNLSGCEQLLEIPELPPTLKSVNVADCSQLIRFAKLSNIIRRKESRMIRSITLLNCHRLCDSLIRDMEERQMIQQSEANLCSLFMSCQQSEFEVVFPGNQVPEGFTHSQKLKEPTGEYKFTFELPCDRNFKSRNHGLAICAAAEMVEINCSVKATIDINARNRSAYSCDFKAKDMKSGHVWLCYIPFITSRYGRSSAPLICGVTFEHKSQGLVQSTSYGVHLVTEANLSPNSWNAHLMPTS